MSKLDLILPHDDELVRREKLFLNLFDKFSVDEGSDPEPDDMDSSEDTIQNNSDSGSSFSEASSNESDSDKSSVINKMTEELQPVIKDRINAWPEKGIHLQLKTIDPSVTVAEWLKANKEFTITTKKYKKTVVNENNKIVTTTTKQTKTTTRKSSFHSFIPRFMQKNVNSSKELGNEVKAIANDIADLNSISQRNDSALAHETKRKDKIRSKRDKKQIQNELIEKKEIPNKLSRKEVTKNQEAVKPNAMNLRSNAMVLPLENGTKRCLRPRVKRQEVTVSEKSDSTVQQIKPKERIRDENADKMQSKSISLKNRTKQDIVQQKDLKLNEKTSKPAVLPLKDGTKRLASLRPPLKEKTMNPVSRQISRTEKHPQLKNVRVNLKNAHPTRVNDPAQENAFTEAGAKGIQEMRDHSEIVTNYDDTFGCSSAEAQKSSENQPKRQSKYQTRRAVRLQKRQIIIHSPGSKQMLGEKIDDKFMLVKKSDYAKHIDPKVFRTMNKSVLNDSIVPINRRIVYEPPASNTINGCDSDDSECEDILLTSYANTGHFLHINIK